MPAKRGPMILRRGDGATSETFTLVSSLRTTSRTINGNSIDVTTADDIDVNDVIWMARINGPKDLSFSASGISKETGALNAVETDFLTDTITNYKMESPNGTTITMPMIVANFEETGSYDGVIEFNITLESAGKPISVVQQ